MASTSPLTIPPDAALLELYRDLHRNPELGFQEHRTADIAAKHLTRLGFAVTTGVGGTGVVGVLNNGRGPTVLLRADMDGLPIREETGLDYASTVVATDAHGRRVPVSHACGHDVHTTCLLGAASALVADRANWSGTLVTIFQPAEELGSGAQAMVDDGLFKHFPQPEVVLGQHVAPLPAGTIAAHPGPAYAASDSLRVRLIGRGAHGSMPQNSIDPVVMQAEAVLRLQTVVSREVAATDVVVLTVGSVRSGEAANVIPEEAELLLNIRTYDPAVREHVLSIVERIVRGVAAAAGAPRPPTMESIERFPVAVNDQAALARTLASFRAWLGDRSVLDPGAGAGSEDVGILATSAGAPLAYWLLGGTDPNLFTSGGLDDPALRSVPANHSPSYAPAAEPTISMGVTALVVAAKDWLGAPEGRRPQVHDQS
ncbi:amidohydrolase [Tessaracoccus sp. OS52]|uniref:amidohydrolase n=1 Tax=Tessaracoccus sp. OS52 TaxID=2886691 RepID=UPI001D12B39B|nr:amidohydrolase [Tessaracoccus sp. OS52]MCC2592117.1 amidohydrolase [Tessaracoccus sp. OS52]